jgi:hypothetical protein
MGLIRTKRGKNGKHGRPFEDGTGEFMQRNTLYIIGNGFDLHFGLPTSTTDFRAILESQKAPNDFSNASELLEWYLPRWSDFESGLAYMNLDEIESDHMLAPDYSSDHEYDRDGVIWSMEN